MEKYIKIYHHDSSIKTLSEYIQKNYIYVKKTSVEDIFNYNRKDIFKQMSLLYKAQYAEKLGKKEITENDLSSDMILPCPCVMKLQMDIITYEIAHEITISQTNLQENTDDIIAFEDDEISKIFQQSGYEINNETTKLSPDCVVKGWFKSLYYSGNLNNTKTFYKSKNNKFFDISKFILNVSTNVTVSGGDFSITLPIINSIETSVETQTSVKENDKYLTYIDRKSLQQDVHDFEKSYFHKAGMIAMEHNYFSWLIQANDLIFISFTNPEEISGGYKNNNDEIQNYEMSYDMIGLVDNVTVHQDGNAQGSVTVTGKDLMKLISDDSSLFFNLSTAWGESQIFSNTESMGKQGDIASTDNYTQKHSPINRIRLFGSNQIDVFAYPFNRSIDFILKGVISQLANIEIVPDYVFQDWGDRRTKFSELSYTSSSSSTTSQSSNRKNNSKKYTAPNIPHKTLKQDKIKFRRLT